jgi:hypothetical protein
MPKVRRRDIPIIIIFVIFGAFWLYTYFFRPDWRRPTGFDPEWQCTGMGAKGGGPDFCIKKELLAPLNHPKPE